MVAQGGHVKTTNCKDFGAMVVPMRMGILDRIDKNYLNNSIISYILKQLNLFTFTKRYRAISSCVELPGQRKLRNKHTLLQSIFT